MIQKLDAGVCLLKYDIKIYKLQREVIMCLTYKLIKLM